MNAQQQTTNHDTDLPLEELTALSQQLLDIAQEETKSLTTGNISQFSSLQQDKTPLAQRYMSLSQAIRIDDEILSNADKDALRNLEKLQTALMNKAQSNNVLIDKTIHKKTTGTEATLFAAQEMGQSHSTPAPNNNV